MRINDIFAEMMVKKTSRADKPYGVSGAQPVARGRDKVELSSDAQGWLDALKAAREADPVDPKKVEDVSRRIAKGSYSVSGSDVADRILGKDR